jgi:hypothetical protein
VRGLSVAGFAHKRPGIALVSLAAIADSADVQITRSRLTNLITHELWHLKGWPHCSQNCVMRPIRAASELDTRLLSLCKGCSKGPQRSIVRYAAAALILALLLVGTNEGLSHLFPLFDTPFSCFATDCHGLCSRPANAPSDSVAIYFQERKLFALRAREDGRSLRDRSVPVVIELNRIAHSSQSMPFVVTRTETDQYGVAIPGNAPLLQVLPRDLSSGETASQLAAHWATALNSALQARTPRNN